MTKPERFNVFLPPTPVTGEMRQQVEDLAESEGVSMAYIMRSALSLFLSQIVSKPDDNYEFSSLSEGGDPQPIEE